MAQDKKVERREQSTQSIATIAINEHGRPSVTTNHSADRTTTTTMSKRIALALANILMPLAVLVFARGFFPYKPFLSGLATFEEFENEELELGLLKCNDRPQRIFDKVIFMTVDALRRWVRSS